MKKINGPCLHPPADPAVDDIWIHAYTYMAYAWDGSAWVYLMTMDPDFVKDMDTPERAYDRAMSIL